MTALAQLPTDADAAAPSAMGVTSTRLENGLQVLVIEDHSAPVATFAVFYKVGSRNETAGATGSAHLLEHMLFKGTERFKKGEIMATLDRLGARWNATTFYDYTNYFETVPVSRLEEALDLEADRMQHSLIADAERDLERIVVRNELERGENSPPSVLLQELWAQAFLAHPYHHPVIGWRSDVEGVPTATLRAFYKTYYVPNNAVAVLVGDVTASQGLALVQKHFGKIPKGADVPEPYTVEPPQKGERRFQIQKPSDLKVVMLGYKTPPAAHADTVPLKLLQLILSGDLDLNPFGDPLDSGISNRLHQAIVEQELATDVGIMYTPMRDPALMTVYALPRPDVDHRKVETALRAQLKRLKTEPVPAEELKRAKARALAAYGLQKDGTNGRAMLLGYFATVAQWQLADTFDQAIQTITAEELMRVASIYFDDSRLTAGWYVPTEAVEAAQTPVPKAAPVKVAAKPAEPKAMRPAKTERPSAPKTERIVLDNGLVLIVRQNSSTPSFALSGVVRAGGAFDPPETPVLAHLTAEMLMRGSKKQDKLAIAKALEEVGASLSYDAGAEDVSISAAGLARDLERVLDLLAETLTAPAFPADELDKLKRETIAQIQQAEDFPSTKANRAFHQALYPKGHPYYVDDPEVSIKALEAVTPEQLAKFHRAHYQGDTIILSIVGDLDAKKVSKQVRAKLGGLGRSGQKGYPIPLIKTREQAERRVITMPEKSNVDVLIGHQTPLTRTSSDYYAAMIANFVLGGGASGLLFQDVRDRKGLTYNIGSSIDASKGAGPWSISLSLNPTNVDTAIDATMAIARRFAEQGVEEAALTTAKAILVGRYKVGLATNAGQARVLASFESNGFPIDMIERHPERVEAVTGDEIRRVLKATFHPDRMVVVIAGSYAEATSAK